MNEKFPNLLVRNDGTVGFVSGLLQTLGLMPEVFLHHGIGERYLARWWQACVALLITSAIFHRHHPKPLLVFGAAYTVMCLLATVGYLWRRWRGGPVVHSRYSGRPWLGKLFPEVSETTIKRLEPLLVGLIGYAITWVNVLLGVFLVVAALGVAWSNLLNGLAAHTHARNLNDSVIEQEIVVERFRAMRGEGNAI